jgi:hypothetical protein
LYARHRFDEPARILGGLDKVRCLLAGLPCGTPKIVQQFWNSHVFNMSFSSAILNLFHQPTTQPTNKQHITHDKQPSICVRPNPVLFQVPDDCKENGQVPHRCIFAVLTWDSIILYDTYHDQPLSIITGIHYSNLVDAAWTANGQHLCVCSTDGFITFVDFAEGELGRVYVPPPTTTPTTAIVKLPPQQQQCQKPSAHDEDDESSCQLANLKIHSSSSCSTVVPTTTTTNATTTLPPCEAGWTAVQAPPTKRAKLETSKRGAAVENLDEANGIPKKKQKKRIQPILLAGTSSTTTTINTTTAATAATSAAATSTTTGS